MLNDEKIPILVTIFFISLQNDDFHSDHGSFEIYSKTGKIVRILLDTQIKKYLKNTFKAIQYNKETIKVTFI